MGIPYATLAIVTDYDCWKDTAEKVLSRLIQKYETIFPNLQVSIELVAATMLKNAETVKQLIVASVKEVWNRKDEFINEAKNAKV